jgi:lysozyme family protein
MAVDMGIAPAIKCAQRAIWATQHNRALLVDDGILGEETLSYLNSVNAVELLSAMRSERAGEYRLVAQHNPNENVYLDGWLNRSYNKTV